MWCLRLGCCAARSRSLECGLMEASPESRGGANSRESRLGDSIQEVVGAL
jgi:hypothetical protein